MKDSHFEKELSQSRLRLPFRRETLQCSAARPQVEHFTIASYTLIGKIINKL